MNFWSEIYHHDYDAHETRIESFGILEDKTVSRIDEARGCARESISGDTAMPSCNRPENAHTYQWFPSHSLNHDKSASLLRYGVGM
jgi:hypothetical protein